MPRDANGTYTLPVTAFVAGEVIISGDMNNNLSDIGLALTQSLATTGVSSMTGPVRLTSGTVDAPGLTFNGFNGAGFYRIGANRLGIAVSSVTAGEINASATAVWDIYTAFASVASIASVIGVSGGVQTTVTITGGLIVTGGMVVGFSATPTADTIQISDAGIKLNNAPPYMGIILNSTDDDGIYYKRDDDFFELWTGDEDTFSAETDRVFFNNGPILLNEVSTPASASSDEVTLFVKDNDGKTRPCYIDQNGVVTFMGGPGYWELITTFTVTTSLTTLDMNFSANYSRVLITGSSVAPNVSSLNIINVQAYNTSFIGGSYEFDGMNIGLANGADDEVRTSNGAPLRDPGTWGVQVPCSFSVEFINTNTVGFKGVFSYAASHGENMIQAVAGINSTAIYSSVNRVSIFFLFGNIFSGNFRVYGQLAT